MPQYSIHPLLLSSRFQFPMQLMLSCNNNILLSLPSVTMLLPSDVTHCSSVGYYRSDNYVFIVRLLNVHLTQVLFTNTNNIVSKLSLFYYHLVTFSFDISSEPYLPGSGEKYIEDTGCYRISRRWCRV